MIKQTLISRVLNKYVFTEHVFGINDCNIILADYLDSFLETNYKDLLYQKYNDIESGLILAKRIGLKTPKFILDKHAYKVQDIKDGDILLSKLKTQKHYSVSIAFRGQAIAENDGTYQMIPLGELKPDLIYRLGE